MKKTKISYCNNCDFKTNEKHKHCPICEEEMEYKEGEKLLINPTLPSMLKERTESNLHLTYYCMKCRKKVPTKACMACNNPTYLYLEYNGKSAIIQRINHLSDFFNKEEVKEIAKKLTQEEKTYLYHNFEDSYRYFYHKDVTKAVICFIFSLIFYCTFLDITFGSIEREYVVLSYFTNGLANLVFLDLIILGVWYLKDASNVLYKQIPQKIILSTVPLIILQIILSAVGDFSFNQMFISGLISILLAFLVYVLIFLKEKRSEK